MFYWPATGRAELRTPKKIGYGRSRFNAREFTYSQSSSLRRALNLLCKYARPYPCSPQGGLPARRRRQ
jgi:hypothetical protein